MDDVRTLVDHRRRFLAFLERRGGNRADAEEILQAAYAGAVDRGVPPDGPEAVVPWFVAVLRNALTDDRAVMIERGDLDERPVAEVARELGITSNDASVRLHRARGALRRRLERSRGTCATHGCLDRSCGGATTVEYRPR